MIRILRYVNNKDYLGGSMGSQSAYGREARGSSEGSRVRVASVLMEAGQGGVPLSQGRHAASEAGNDKK